MLFGPNPSVPTSYLQGDPYVSERFFKNGCGIEMSQAMPTYKFFYAF